MIMSFFIIFTRYIQYRQGHKFWPLPIHMSQEIDSTFNQSIATNHMSPHQPIFNYMILNIIKQIKYFWLTILILRFKFQFKNNSAQYAIISAPLLNMQNFYYFFTFCCSVKCRATRLCSESESGVRNILQDPLLVHAQWSYMVSKVLASSADVTDFSHIAMMLQDIEVEHSLNVFER